MKSQTRQVKQFDAVHRLRSGAGEACVAARVDSALKGDRADPPSLVRNNRSVQLLNQKK